MSALPRLLTRRTPLRPTPCLRRLNSTKTPPPKNSFRAQLYDSTARRIASERSALSQRIASGQNAPPPRPERVSTATLSGVFGATVIAVGFYLLGQGSVPTPSTASTAPLDSLSPPVHDVSRGNMEASWTEFVALLGRENVSTSTDELARVSQSDWSSFHADAEKKPFLIVFPSTTEEVAGVAKICHARKIPITPFSGGTSLEGHFAPTRGGVCVDFRRMDKVLAVHEADMDVVVQPAVGWEQLNLDLAPTGLFFPPDPGPGAMIGGMVGTGCSGTNAARYGTMRDWVLALTVVLADGTIIKTRQRPRKSSAGYDLTRLFIGSEGTLGLVTEATLKLSPIPESTSVAVASFPSVAAAAAACAEAMRHATPLAAVELLDDVQMHCINEAGATTRSWAEKPTLFLKFSGTPAAVKEQVAALKKITARHGSHSWTAAASPAEAAELWQARKEALWSVMAQKRAPSDRVWTTDVAVPLSRLAEIVDVTKRDIKDSGLLGSIVGHVGDGNFHAILLFGEQEREVAEGVVGRMVRRAVEMEGTVTGEHGVGLVKRGYLENELGVATVDAMRRVKMALDPGCLLNS
ncbi:hypothetical protein EDC01DRAFT_189267 [Geopyxis carbonaria]|nr:hypothetical protein EDC01DRAFT_189267 [Geopyxis carbonaria]